jgi:hypothetical protein
MQSEPTWSADKGAPVEVLPRTGGKNPWCFGVLGTARGFVIEVAITGICPLEPHDDVILAGGPTGSRMAALARFREMRGDTAVFKRMSPWRPVDTRAFVRFPVELRTVVVGEHEDSPRHGFTIDLSRGGLAVLIDGTLDSESIDVAFGDANTPYISCRVVGQRRATEGTILHLAFAGMGAPEKACIDALVDELSAALELAAAS